jgi:hypothetical protein
MPDKTLTGEFHADHTQVVQALLDLRDAIAARDPLRVRATLGGANRLVGPHFKFEERHLYPSLTPFLGETRIQKLINEHDGIFRAVGNLVSLAGKDSWTEAEAASAAANLEMIWEHPVTCDGLSLYVERLPAGTQSALLDRMEELRSEGTTLLQYRIERAA